MKIKKFLNENKIIVFLAVYGIFYLCSFCCLEQRDVPLHIIHSKIDDRIPFCEYFIIPYLFWFFYLALTVIYIVFYRKNHQESERLVYSMCAGMSVFLIISFIYPNGHNLRPTLTGTNIFSMCVKILYQIDTSTNILPSLHVFETVVCSIALLRSPGIKERKGLAVGVWICSVLIIASTMLLKQHSIVDVIVALILNVFCYVLFYKINFRKEERYEKCGRKKKFLQFLTY